MFVPCVALVIVFMLFVVVARSGDLWWGPVHSPYCQRYWLRTPRPIKGPFIGSSVTFYNVFPSARCV